MDEKAQNKSTLLSRLPKFGVKSPGTSSLANGACISLPGQPQGGIMGAAGKQNGSSKTLLLLPQLEEGQSGPQRCTDPRRAGKRLDNAKGGDDGRLQQPIARLGQPETKKAASFFPNKGKMTPVSAARTDVAPQTLPQAAKATNRNSFPGRPLSGQNFYSKSNLNCFSGPKFGMGLQRPRANSSSTRSSSRESMTQSSDSLKSLSLDSIVRSQSFSHFKQIPSPTCPAMTRSYSFNKAVELSKPSSNPQLRTKALPAKKTADSIKGPNVKGSLAKSGFGFGSSALSTLKKPLLPNFPAGKPSVLSYRMTRPSLVKHPRPVVPGKVVDSCLNSPNDKTAGGSQVEASEKGADHSCGQGHLAEPAACTEEEQVPLKEQEANLRYLGEPLDEMSLSSTSSLERNDYSEEYLDDFDNLGDGGAVTLTECLGDFPLLPTDDVPDTGQADSGTEGDLGLLSQSMEWVDMGLQAGLADEMESSLMASQAPLPFCPERDFPTGSSLELSPSDSSDGTYMWDEEGLEPLGSALHHCGSYDDSVEINSLDILNDLDNLESCDLDDDDLMLDADLPEDGSLNNVDTENMSHLERGRRHGQGYWRRRPQQRWTGQEHFQHDSRGPVFLGSPAGQYDGYSGPSFSRTSQENIVALDELTLCHMTQDCTSVKNQLLKLQRLLQEGDDSGGGTALQDMLLAGPRSPESQENSSTAVQIEELLNEIRQLKDELKSKDDTIKQLQQQMSTRCHCHKRTPESKEMRQRHNDKATQTAWRGNPPQILQPSSPRRTDTPSKRRLARSTPTEDPSSCPGSTLHNANDSRLQQPQQTVLLGPVSGPPSAAHSAPALGDPAAEQPPDPDKLSLLLSAPLKIDEADHRPAEPRARRKSFGRSLQIQPLPDVSPLASNSQVKTPPRLSQKLSKRQPPGLLQPPRFHNRVLKASEVSEVPAATKGKSPESSPNHKKTPESRPNSNLQPPNTALLFKTKQPPQSLETQPDGYSESKDSGSTQAPTSLGLPRSLVQRDSSAQLSRLPKPKVH
ncbi:serine-rich coiled-coil domain-containing protein 2-like isoform X1 [Acipenser oxyrinchus oxyrinchus]|uniref:Serine-rich coiled-coil domain-containing protein 2-like isoform X1 n=1 Tax=Acipenser oxyrinchus oxyrinchus TaxID=40147 RepID=A0AAD8DAT4_ACIOX|nr:serine-rich coiled-coil domain-containing protein 2-like isoform X1 [Acipenser oxyrinchus oxyrinchus]